MATKDARQHFQTRQHMMTADYEVYHYFDRGMNSVHLHHHDFFEIYFLIEGRVSSQIEGRNYDLKPGDVVLMNSSELHQTIIHDLDKPYERIILWLNRNFLRSLSTDLSDLALCFEGPQHRNIIRTDPDSQQYIRGLLNKLLGLKHYTGFGLDLYPRTYLVELLLFLNDEITQVKQRPRIEVRKNRLIDSVIEHINRHIDEEIKIDDLTEVFFLSKFHLCREFKNQTGTTLHRYIIQKKLILAKELILKNLPITEVYQRAGFGDYSNFFRAFRNEYNLTPRQFYDRVARGVIEPLEE
jgi:AraC-like DNA-binding protein